MTARQEEVLDFITTELATKGYPPTLREIGVKMGIRSTNGVNEHLRALERKGFITREDMKSRCIRLVDKPRLGHPPSDRPTPLPIDAGSMVEVKVYRRIVAGPAPFLATNIATVARVGRSMVGPGELFGLRIQGESMAEAGFQAGDDVLFVQRCNVERGQLACVLLGDEAAVRFVYPEKDYVRLQAASAATPPVLLRSSDWSPRFVLGVGTGMLRRYGPPPA